MGDSSSDKENLTRITLDLPFKLAVKLEEARVRMGLRSKGATVINLLELLLSDEDGNH